MSPLPPLFRKRDGFYLVLVAVVTALLFLFISSHEGTVAVVRQNGTVTHTLPLHTDTSLTLTNRGYHLTLTVADGQVQVTQSDCPDGICRRTAPIHKAGQSLVCLPAACSVTIEGEPSFDGVTY